MTLVGGIDDARAHGQRTAAYRGRIEELQSHAATDHVDYRVHGSDLVEGDLLGVLVVDGAFRDGQPIHVTGQTCLAEAIVALGDYGTATAASNRNTAMLAIHAALAPRALRIRMLGSAAVDLALLADAALGASITLGNRTWDMAAGAVIAREAGAQVTDLDGTDHTTSSRCTIAATPNLIENILDVVQHASTTAGFTGEEGSC